VELLRRIFVTVRDRNWREISPTQWVCTVEEATASIRVEARHISDLVDFEWRGTLQLSADGRSVHFDCEGAARRTMDVCRLGLVVLHPIEATMGARICAQTDDNLETFIVSSAIAPQPIVDGIPAAMTQPFSSLSIERSDLSSLELQFGGDLFEIEDQRNWGDASFKTYCTPLRLKFPREIKMGTRIAHRLDLLYSPALSAARAGAGRGPPRTRAAVFPAIGRERRGCGSSDAKDLGWQHVYIDFRVGDQIEDLPRNVDEHAGPLLEIGVEESYPDNQWTGLVSWIAENRRRIARLLLYGAATAPPSSASLARWRAFLDAAGTADLPIFTAIRGYFVEFNRSTGAQLGSPAGIAFPLTATVHADDPITIAENVVTIVDMADTAQLLMRSRNLALVPLALYYPPSPAPPVFPPAMIAPWLAATVLNAAIAGVNSITLAEDVATLAPASLIEHLTRCADFRITAFGDQPNGVHGALLRPPGHGVAKILAINLNSTPSQLKLKPITFRVRSLVDMSDITHVEITAFAVRWLECDVG
jgi:hypothetical protein